MNFEDYFSQTYGQRWESLKKAMLADEKQVLMPNTFPNFEHQNFQHTQSSEIQGLDNCIWFNDANRELARQRHEWNSQGNAQTNAQSVVASLQNQDTELPDSPTANSSENKNCLKYYVLDPASIVAALQLQVREGDSVLDMCAAPGGKSIVLANALNATGHMIANEISNDRRERMLNVFRQYLLEERRMRVHIKGKDAARFGLEMPGQFDRILLDAPCSSERHIMHQGKNKSSLDWTLKQAQRNSTRQYSLACAALLGACSKGRIVYATCSINPMENDDVMAKLEKKKSDTFRFITELSTEVLPGIEKTKYGWQYLPDQSGLGPLYFSVLEKI